MGQGGHLATLIARALGAAVALGLAGYAASLAIWVATAENDTVTTAMRVLVTAVPASAVACFVYAAAELVRWRGGRQVRARTLAAACAAGLAAIPATCLLYLAHITAG